MKSRLYSRLAGFVLFFVAAAASFNGFYDKWHLREPGTAGGWAVAGIAGLLDGTAPRPYVYRQLVPTLANWLDAAAPEAFRQRAIAAVSAHRQLQLASPLAEQPAYLLRYNFVYLLTFCFALVAVYAMYKVCQAGGAPAPVSLFAPVLMILLFPYLLCTGGYFYDYVELAFFALAFRLALGRSWWWLLPVALLGTWNKESFVLFVPTLYPLLRARMARKTALSALGAVLAVSCAVNIAVRLHFAGNAGGGVEWHFGEQLASLHHPLMLLFGYDKTYGLYALNGFSLLPLLLLGWTVWRAWPFFSQQMRQHAKIAALINLPLYVLFCAPRELRDLSMLYMVLLLAIAINLNREAERAA